MNKNIVNSRKPSFYMSRERTVLKEKEGYLT
jgi:hypothetical protein